MTDRDEDIINTIRHYMKTLEETKDISVKLANMAQFSGLMKGLDLVLGKERSQKLYELASAML